jgi:hypothetical protein
MKTCAEAVDALRAGHRRPNATTGNARERGLQSRIRLRRRSGVPVLVVLLLVVLQAAPTANASLDRGLCSTNASRGSIPASFAVDACFDGQTLHIYNNTTVPLGVAVQGDIGSPKRKETDHGLAASATRLVSSDPDMLLPGDTLEFPVGPGAVSAKLRSTTKGSFYLLASAAQFYFPTGKAAVLQAYVGMIKEVDEDFSQYYECEQSSSRIHRAGCHVLLVRNIAFAGARFVTHGALSVASDNLSKILNAFESNGEYSEWLSQTTGSLGAVLHSGTITLNGIGGGSASTGIGGGSSSTGPSGSSGPGTPSGPPPAAPAYSETSGSVVHTWTDYMNAGGTEGPEIPSNDTVQIACKVSGFRVEDGNTWWYLVASSPWNSAYYASADAFYNNGQTSGSLIGTPFVDLAVPNCSGGGEAPGGLEGPSSSTFAETSGGVVHTWSDYADAGGGEGPEIPSNDTVQIACKVEGFRVADGNTWWYRIASTPWNGDYYGSADAFYNNGATSGSLLGTPFLDPNVPNC